MRTARIAEIELLRFLATIGIVIFHLQVEIIPRGFLFVEMFFLLSGFLLTKSVIGLKTAPLTIQLNSGFLHVTLRKIKSFYPELLVCTLIGIAGGVAQSLLGSSPVPLGDFIKSSIINNLLLARMFGFSNPSAGFYPPSWYLSSMILGVVLLYPIIKYIRCPYTHLIAGSFLLGVLLYDNCGCLNGDFANEIFYIYSGNIRALCCMFLGAWVYYIVQFVKEMKPSRISLFFISVIKYILYAIMFFAVTSNTGNLDLLFILCAIGVLVLSFSKLSYEIKMYDCIPFNNICIFAGKISLSIYLGHNFGNTLKDYDILACLPSSVECYLMGALFSIAIFIGASCVRKFMPGFNFSVKR